MQMNTVPIERPWFHEPLYLIWVSSAIVVFPILFFVTAPYGRFYRSSFGAAVSGAWGWFLQEIPSPIIVDLAFYYVGGVFPAFDLRSVLTSRTAACLLFWHLHYAHRAIVWPLRRKMGLTTASVVAAAVGFNFVNGYLNGVALAEMQRSSIDSQFDTLFVLGLLMGIVGAYINVSSDEIILRLAREKDRQAKLSDGKKRYVVPSGGLYAYVASPNYLGEIIEWTGFALMAGLNSAAVAFAVWTAANLVPRAWANRAWYREQFKDKYPASRRAIIPFVF
jgi:3-oxo-5-alpha-steroid 4-dehydrogenase 1